jgi:voltage-gated potassium channel
MNISFVHKRLLKQRKFRELLIVSVGVSVLLGILIVPIERSHPESTIRTFSDGLWWAIQTLTTVGYGDTTPVTDIGRVLGVVMQVVGAILFGTVIAMISSSMSRRQEEFYWNRLFERIDHLSARIEEIEKRTGFLIQDTANPEK